MKTHPPSESWPARARRGKAPKADASLYELLLLSMALLYILLFAT